MRVISCATRAGAPARARLAETSAWRKWQVFKGFSRGSVVAVRSKAADRLAGCQDSGESAARSAALRMSGILAVGGAIRRLAQADPKAADVLCLCHANDTAHAPKERF